MKKIILIIFYPAQQAAKMGCVGVFIAIIYIIIVLGVFFHVLGQMLGGSGCN